MKIHIYYLKDAPEPDWTIVFSLMPTTGGKTFHHFGEGRDITKAASIAQDDMDHVRWNFVEGEYEAIEFFFTKPCAVKFLDTFPPTRYLFKDLDKKEQKQFLMELLRLHVKKEVALLSSA